MDQAIRKRSVTVAGHRTSFSIEEAFWRRLKAFAGADGISLNTLIERIDQGRQGNLSSAVRVYVLERTAAGASESTEAAPSASPSDLS